VNAVLVLRFRISAFLATLATGGIIDGAYTVYGGGTDISPLPTSKAQLPAWFSGLHSFGSFETKVPLALSWVIVVILAASALFSLRLRVTDTSREQLKMAAGSIAVVGLLVALAVARLPQQMSWGMLVAFVLYWLIWVVLKFTAFGRGLYAIGGNAVAARLSGVKVNRSIAIAFVTSGTLAALAGIVLSANQGSATPGIADSFLLPAYAAAFLSTVILSNGRFHIWGTFIGAMCVVYISQGLVLGGVKFTWTAVINGAVLVVAVGVSTTLRRRSAT
jgi:ribose/xylose/arabinose/galactoside ABC-type transport system permease subunit